MGLFSQLPGNVIHIPGEFSQFSKYSFFNTFLWKAGKYSQRAWDLRDNWVLIPNSLVPIPNELLGLENEQKGFSKTPWDLFHFPNQCQRTPAGFPRFDWESSLNIYFSKVTLVIRKHHYLQFYRFSYPIHLGCTRTSLKKISARRVNFRIKFPG